MDVNDPLFTSASGLDLEIRQGATSSARRRDCRMAVGERITRSRELARVAKRRAEPRRVFRGPAGLATRLDSRPAQPLGEAALFGEGVGLVLFLTPMLTKGSD